VHCHREKTFINSRVLCNEHVFGWFLEGISVLVALESACILHLSKHTEGNKSGVDKY